MEHRFVAFLPSDIQKNVYLQSDKLKNRVDIMKKLSVLLVVMFASVTIAGAQNWSLGVRTGSGFQAVAQLHLTHFSYLEFRGGMSWLGGPTMDYFDDLDDGHVVFHRRGVTADFTALYNWNAANFDWTNGHGNWFLDVGAGVNFGGRSRYSYVGLAGMGRMGYTFDEIPLSLSCDWTPMIGPEFIRYRNNTDTDFYWRGLANVGFTATWKF
jgi:hypothetical protein